jgi:hypothetical protein
VCRQPAVCGLGPRSEPRAEGGEHPSLMDRVV